MKILDLSRLSKTHLLTQMAAKPGKQIFNINWLVWELKGIIKCSLQINWWGNRVRWGMYLKCMRSCWKRWLNKTVNWSNGSSQGSTRTKKNAWWRKISQTSFTSILSILVNRSRSQHSLSLHQKKMFVTLKYQTDSHLTSKKSHNNSAALWN